MHTVQFDVNKHIYCDDAARYTNHSCNPTATLDFTTYTLKANKDIKEGSEITFNYLTTEWIMNSPFECNCNESCMKNIKGAKVQ